MFSHDATRLSQCGPAAEKDRLRQSNPLYQRDCTIYVAKTKALISCAVSTQLICAFVFAYAKRRLSHDGAQL